MSCLGTNLMQRLQVPIFITYLLTYLHTPWGRVLLMKLTGFQLVKKFPAFCGTRMFIPAFTNSRHLSLSWARSIPSILAIYYFLKIHLNIILPPKPGSTKWSLSLRFPHQNIVNTSTLPIRATCPRLYHSYRFGNRVIGTTETERPHKAV